MVLREGEPGNWARGGVSRVPGPPLPYAVDIVHGFIECHTNLSGDSVARPTPAADDYLRLGESYAEQGSLIFAEGVAGGIDVLDRFQFIAGRGVGHQRWMGNGHPVE